MKSVEKSAKTVDEAVQLALSELGVSSEDVEIEVVDEGAKGFLGFGNKEAVVKVSLKANPQKDAKDFLSGLFNLMREDVFIDCQMQENLLNIDLSGPDMGIIIGKRGETLDAIQHLVSLAVNKGESDFVKVSVDTENYRKKRVKTLETLGRKLAVRVAKTKKNITLEPMNSYERRIIHASLQNDKYVTTYSIGQSPNRKVVIAYKTKDNR